MRLWHAILFGALLCQGLVAAAQWPQLSLYVPEKVQRFFDALEQIAHPTSPLDQLRPPKCLDQLTGGVDAIERSLADELDKHRTPMILMTSKNDKSNSLVAMRNFYDAVQLLCQEAELETEDMTSAASSSDSIDGDNDFSSPKADSLHSHATIQASSYYFAHVSFDTEPDIVWRWWVWKIPVIVFVTASNAASSRPYDLRYWKIGFKPPSKSDVIEAIPDRHWMNLPVWDSALAPGMPWEMVTTQLARGFGQTYKVLDPIPNWILTILGSILGSVLVTALHSRSGTAGSTGAARSHQR